MLDSESDEEDTHHDSHVTQFLKYLNDSCSRCRISYLVLTMKDSSNEAFDPVELLKDMATQNKQERLSRIIEDVLSGKIIDRSDSHNIDGQNNT